MTKIILGFLIVFFSFELIYSQNSPIASQLENNVDLFSGDFKHNIPLINLTGPNGERFPIQLN